MKRPLLVMIAAVLAALIVSAVVLHAKRSAERDVIHGSESADQIGRDPGDDRIL